MTDKIEIWKTLAKAASQTPYQDTYLWKYIEYELSAGILTKTQGQNRNAIIQNKISDAIPKIPQAEAQKTELFLGGLEPGEILAGMVPLRRPYKGKLVHTAMDAYLQALDGSKYLAVEPDYGGQEDGEAMARHRHRFHPWHVVNYYGQDSVDKKDLWDFLQAHYIRPMEAAFQRTMPEDVLQTVLDKCSLVLKERKAYIRFFGEVLGRVQPKVVCYTHGADRVLCFLREAAQAARIPTAEIAHGAAIRNFCSPDTLSYADYSLLYSDLITVPMQKNGIPNVYTIGKPGIYEDNAQQILPERLVVVSFISSLEPGLYGLALRIAGRLDQRKYLVVYKLHSAEICTEEMQGMVAENENFQILDGMVDVKELYAVSNIVVGIHSTGILDALPFCGIKILVLKKENEKEKDLILSNFSFYDELCRLGDIQAVEGEEQLLREIIQYEKGKDYRDRVNHFWPDDARARWKSFLGRFLDPAQYCAEGKTEHSVLPLGQG